MKMTFIGSGSAFTIDNYHSNILIENECRKLLIDCGSDARFSLAEIGYSYDDVDSVYISHVHADHVGGLEWLGFCRKFNSDRASKPELIAHKNILKNLWEHSLAGGMKSLDSEDCSLRSFFQPLDLSYPGNFSRYGIDFELVKTMHVKNNESVIDSYGLFISWQGNFIFLTTDSRLLLEEFLPYYEKADIIFQDCETHQKVSGVHAHYKELVNLPIEIKRKSWLYHYNTGPLPDAEKDGFLGFVEKGKVFSFARNL